MNEMALPLQDEGAKDAAWASINTPLSVKDLVDFCQDVERLFRINPMLEFKRFANLGSQHYEMRGRNLSQVPPFEFDVSFNAIARPDGIHIDYEQGIKSRTEIKVEPTDSGARLTILERYDRLPASERELHLGEVDRSLTTWADYLQRYLIMWRKWSRFGWWRWYMRHIWQPMKPMSRRITYTLLWITVVEIALIALGVAIYFIEYR